MKISVLTLFPDMFRGILDEGLLRIAMDKSLLNIALYNIRDFAESKHHQTDDYTFGGGPGMLMMPQPAIDAIIHATQGHYGVPYRIYLSPRGQPLTDTIARQLTKHSDLLLLCGHYEGMDQRVIDGYIDEELSIGDYILSGGELPAMVLMDAIVRHIDGVLGNEVSAQQESFDDGLLEYPQYTRPADFRGACVPPVLQNGNHAAIQKWRREQSLLVTRRNRPDLLARAELTEADRAFLDTLD